MPEDREMRRWFKEPAPGQFRGEGDWVEYKGSDADWQALVATDFLPTHVGETPPEEEKPR